MLNRMIRRLALAALFLAGVQGANAATYYVDAERGNDTWNGLAQSSSAGRTGPWQTLARLSTAPLAPGDSVLLACGSVWNETLRIPASGTAAAPIFVTSGPGYCQTPPAISGSVNLPASMWVVHSGSIYKAQLPIENILNAGLSTGLSGWHSWSPTNDSTMSLDTVCSGSPVPCMAFTSGTSDSIAVSNDFQITAGTDYAVSLLVKAPVGKVVKVIVRRDAAPYESFTTDRSSTGTGAWQTVSYTFRADRTVPNARVDILVPGGQNRINLREVHVRAVSDASGVGSVYVDDATIRPAHHPNFGQTGSSPYAAIPTAGAKTTLDTTGLALPAGALLSPGIGVSMRTRPWRVEERRVVGVAGRRLTFDKPTEYTTDPGYGYFLTGALWMLDAPGEWYFDSAARTLYVWMPDGSQPGSRVAISSLENGIDLRSRSYVEIAGLEVRRARTGVKLGSNSAIRIRDTNLHDLADYGVDADNCVDCAVEQSNIERTGIDAILASGTGTARFALTDTTIGESGTVARTDGWRSLPRPSTGAVRIGANATIARNRLVETATVGIAAGASSAIEANFIGRSCLVLNDCGGVHVNYTGPNTSIIGNVVQTMPGNVDGLPANWKTHTAGIYLDDRTSNAVVRGNSVTDADYGIHIHDSSDSTIDSNVLYGNRRYQIWMQEQTNLLRPGGDMFGNRIESNLVVPLAGGPGVFLESEIGYPGAFASFAGNHYSALLSPRVLSEFWYAGAIGYTSASYTVAEWQGKGQDIGAIATVPAGYASFVNSGGNIIPNGNLASGRTGWSWWNLTAPFAQGLMGVCGTSPCISLAGGGSTTVLSSPNFSVTGGQWYRVTFDAATSQANQPLSVLVRRGGGGTASYEPLMTVAETFFGSTTWKRYSFLFKATKSVKANDPVTREFGARVDFDRTQPGTSVSVAKLEMVPVAQAQAALQQRLLINTTQSAISLACLAADASVGLCDKFTYVKSGNLVSWPAYVAPLSAEPIFTRDYTLVDTDSDGVANQQDTCPNTPAGQAVNSQGCGISQ